MCLRMILIARSLIIIIIIIPMYRAPFTVYHFPPPWIQWGNKMFVSWTFFALIVFFNTDYCLLTAIYLFMNVTNNVANRKPFHSIHYFDIELGWNVERNAFKTRILLVLFYIGSCVLGEFYKTISSGSKHNNLLLLSLWNLFICPSNGELVVFVSMCTRNLDIFKRLCICVCIFKY